MPRGRSACVPLVAGLIIVMAGYSAAFITLAGVSLAAMFMFLLLMPETRESPRSRIRAKPRHQMGRPSG